MSLPGLAVLYALVGAGCATARLMWRVQPDGRFGDAALLAFSWPLFGPFLLLRLQGDTSQREVAFLVTMRRARETPLGCLLPDANTSRALANRLRVATGKVTEIDQILERPEFCEKGALTRVGDLRARGASDTAISTATMRVQNIRRLRALRNRFAGELDEISELLLQLSTQAEVVRLAGGVDPSSAELARELVLRVEGLDSMLDDDPRLLDA